MMKTVFYSLFSDLNPSSFTVFFTEPDADLLITKVTPAGSPDSVEFSVTRSGTLKNTEYCVRNSCIEFPGISVIQGQKIIFYSVTGTDDLSISDGSFEDYWEFFGGKSLIATDNVIQVRRKQISLTDGSGVYYIDQEYQDYWSHWESNPTGILDALVYANNNGSWTGCGTTGNTSCLQELLDSGYWKIVRQDGSSADWLESDAVLSDGRTLKSGDSFSRKVLQSSKDALNPSQDWEFLPFL